MGVGVWVCEDNKEAGTGRLVSVPLHVLCRQSMYRQCKCVMVFTS